MYMNANISRDCEIQEVSSIGSSVCGKALLPNVSHRTLLLHNSEQYEEDTDYLFSDNSRNAYCKNRSPDVVSCIQRQGTYQYFLLAHSVGLLFLSSATAHNVSRIVREL